MGQTIAIGPSGAYVFTKPSGGWTDATETAKLTTIYGAYDGLGASVAVSGDGGAVFAGALDAAYVFIRPGPVWTDAVETALLTTSDGVYEDYFGTAIATSNDGGTVVGGAPGKDAYGEDQGAAYVFVMPETGWVDAAEAATLTASDGGRRRDCRRSAPPCPHPQSLGLRIRVHQAGRGMAQSLRDSGVALTRLAAGPSTVQGHVRKLGFHKRSRCCRWRAELRRE